MAGLNEGPKGVIYLAGPVHFGERHVHDGDAALNRPQFLLNEPLHAIGNRPLTLDGLINGVMHQRTDHGIFEAALQEGFDAFPHQVRIDIARLGIGHEDILEEAIDVIDLVVALPA